MSGSKIIHIDADCFYAAIEMRDDPTLMDIPIAVGGSEVRGVIATCNYPARAFGVRSAMATRTALKLCPALKLIRPRMDAYREAAVEMRRIFRDYTDLIEPLSLDEAYLDVSACTLLSGSATRIAEEIRRRVKARLGITVSAGVAPNKMLAKIASDWHKPDGICVIIPAQIDAFVQNLPVKKIHGVGQALTQKLANYGITTCGDLQKFDVFTLTQRFGSMGPRLYDLSRGIDTRPVNPSRRRKSLSVEHTYSQDIHSLDECVSALPELIAKLKLRLTKLDSQYRVNKLFVKIKFADFTSTTVERAGEQLSPREFTVLLSEAYTRGQRAVRLLGVGVGFKEEVPHLNQMGLFGD